MAGLQVTSTQNLTVTVQIGSMQAYITIHIHIHPPRRE